MVVKENSNKDLELEYIKNKRICVLDDSENSLENTILYWVDILEKEKGE